MRIEPAPSLPWCSGPIPEAAATPAPADDAPALAPCCHGLWVIPVSGQRLMPLQPNSEVVVLPRTMAPSSCSRVTSGVSSAGWWPAKILLPNCVGMSLVIVRSLMVTGMPCSRPIRSPVMSACSARLASSMARSAAK